ncbi:MAG: DUF523 domain-containing protein [Thermofilum sp.]
MQGRVARPRILLSACLGVKPVRYDGSMVFDTFVEALKKHVDFVAVCPEVGIGLGAPRSPLALTEESGRVELIVLLYIVRRPPDNSTHSNYSCSFSRLYSYPGC